MRKNEQGAALLWVICALVILTVLLSGFMSIASSYYKEERSTLALKQADYFARSGIELVISEIAVEFEYPETEGEEPTVTNSFIPSSVDDPLTVSLDLQSSYLDSPCTVKIELLDSNTILLTSSATVGKQRSEVMAKLTSEDGYQWTFLGYITY